MACLMAIIKSINQSTRINIEIKIERKIGIDQTRTKTSTNIVPVKVVTRRKIEIGTERRIGSMVMRKNHMTKTKSTEVVVLAKIKNIKALVRTSTIVQAVAARIRRKIGIVPAIATRTNIVRLAQKIRRNIAARHQRIKKEKSIIVHPRLKKNIVLQVQRIKKGKRIRNGTRIKIREIKVKNQGIRTRRRNQITIGINQRYCFVFYSLTEEKNFNCFVYIETKTLKIQSGVLSGIFTQQAGWLLAY